MLRARLLVKSTFQVDLKRLVMRPTAPENFDGDATTERLDPAWKAQVYLLDPTRRSSLFQSSLHRHYHPIVRCAQKEPACLSRLILPQPAYV